MSSPNVDARGQQQNKRQRTGDGALDPTGDGSCFAAAAEPMNTDAEPSLGRDAEATGRTGSDAPSVDYSFTNSQGDDDDLAVPTYLCDPNPPSQPKIDALKNLKGSRLAPLEKLLAPHPPSFITTIIESSSSMLTLLFTIKQREISFRRFDSQVVARSSDGTAIIDQTTGEEKMVPFIPRSIRDKNPVQCSGDVKEDERIVAALQDSLARHEAYKSAQAKSIKKVAGLELTIRKEKLGALFLDPA